MTIPTPVRQLIFLCRGILATAEKEVGYRLTLHSFTFSHQGEEEELEKGQGQEWRYTVKLFFEGGFYIRARMSEHFLERNTPQTDYSVVGRVEYWWSGEDHQYK